MSAGDKKAMVYRYFEELAEGLAVVGDVPEAAMSLRKALSERYDIEVVGPPRQAQ
jgi:hypothetical protein